jgi:hypothetical protein
MDARTRYTVTLLPDFEAKPNSDTFSLDPAFTFHTTDGEPVYAFNRTPLLKARWCEPGTLDARQSWRTVGAYTFGREIEAMVERTAKGYLRVVWLDRGDVKAKAQS